MTCKHCCGADQLFDIKGAKKELKKYKRKGPGKSTNKLIKLIFGKVDLNGKSLLDIGGGIGAIQWGFLKNGGEATMHIDASQSYLLTAEQYASEHNFADRTSFVFGDFVEKAGELASYDYITLDKVICCYPDYKSLLREATKKCHNSIAVTYPFGGFISRLIASFNKIYFYVKKNPFRTYIHSPKEIERFILTQGFEIKEKCKSFPWHVQIYRRSELN